MPTSELNRENVSGKLSERGIGEKEVKQIIDLIDECEFSKYSPASAKGDMQPVYDEGVNVINSLEDAFKQTKTAGDEK